MYLLYVGKLIATTVVVIEINQVESIIDKLLGRFHEAKCIPYADQTQRLSALEQHEDIAQQCIATATASKNCISSKFYANSCADKGDIE
jgi:hypothetical protein